MTEIPEIILSRFQKKYTNLSKLYREAIVRKINRTGTIKLVGKVLSDLLGYNKFTQITQEFKFDGTFLDFAVQEDSPNKFLVDVKTFQSPLTQEDTMRVVNYTLERNFRWAVITNGIRWKLYEICPMEKMKRRLRLSFNFLALSLEDEDDLQNLYLLSREGMNADSIQEFNEYKKVASKFHVNMNTQDEFFFNEIGRNFKYTRPKPRTISDMIFNNLAKQFNGKRQTSHVKGTVRKMIKDPSLK